jgi:hypothetical protein
MVLDREKLLSQQLDDLQKIVREGQQTAEKRARDSILHAPARVVSGPLLLRNGHSVGTEGVSLKVHVGQLPQGDLELLGFQKVENYCLSTEGIQGFTIPYVAITSEPADEFLFAASISRRLFDEADRQSKQKNVIDWMARLNHVFAFITDGANE